MKLFFDTSALVKYFHEEEGTDVVTSLIEAPNQEIWISELALIEFVSTLYKKYRAGLLSLQQIDSAVAGFEEGCTNFNVEPLGRVVSEEALKLLQRYGLNHGLRTLDALQLGAFALIAEKDFAFVSADENLCNVALLAGYTVLNPIKKT